MKYNIKNRPKIIYGESKYGMFDTKEVEEWFEGFQKELREYMKNLEGTQYRGWGWKEELIKEILGE